MDNKEDREWVLENVESINADVKDIDELCCALEHSTIFAIDHIQTFATRLIDLDYKYKNQQQELERYKNIIDKTIKILKNIYMLDNVSITNNAVEQIDKAINLLEVENESKMR